MVTCELLMPNVTDYPQYLLLSEIIAESFFFFWTQLPLIGYSVNMAPTGLPVTCWEWTSIYGKVHCVVEGFQEAKSKCVMVLPCKHFIVQLCFSAVISLSMH